MALIKQGDTTLFEIDTGYAHKGYRIKNHIHTRFDTASITKLFTSAGIVLLENEGKLKFTDKIHDEDYSALFIDSPNYAIRENKDFLKNFAYKKTNFKAGAAVRYNNCAFVLLGLAIEKLTGIGYREFITGNIFKAFGMEKTCFHAMEAIAPDVAEGYYLSDKEWRKNIYSYLPIGTGDSGAKTTIGGELEWTITK